MQAAAEPALALKSSLVPARASGAGTWALQFADESLNAAAPLTNRKPASQTRNFDAQLRGPILPGRFTATINVQNRESDSEGSAIRAVGINGPVNEGISRVQEDADYPLRAEPHDQ